MPGAIDTKKPVILVEGEMDALSCAAAGIENVFSTGGTEGLTGPKIKQYLLSVPEIIIFFDKDIAGRKASGLVAINENDKRKTNLPDTLRKAGYKGIIKTASFPDEFPYKDQDEAICAGKLEAVLQAIEDAKEWMIKMYNRSLAPA